MRLIKLNRDFPFSLLTSSCRRRFVSFQVGSELKLMFRLVRQVIWGSAKRKSFKCCVWRRFFDSRFTKHTLFHWMPPPYSKLVHFKSDNAKLFFLLLSHSRRLVCLLLLPFINFFFVFANDPQNIFITLSKVNVRSYIAVSLQNIFSLSLFFFGPQKFAKQNWLSAMTDTFVNATCRELSTLSKK